MFATTEIRKVPVTVLSRCQRFDLKRVDADVLMTHLANISGKEGVQAEPEALGLIARAAEGSVRDSLSLLDQAIAHAAGTVRAEDVRQMLGLADRNRVIDLFASLASGDIAAAFKEFRDQYDTGADPVVVLSDLAEFVNFVTRVKVVPATADNLALGETERTRGRDFAAKLSMRVLSRMWQMLLKGIAEVQSATRPQAAAEMVLVRIAYVADLPTPDEAIKMIDQGGGASPVLGGNGGGNGAPRGPSAMLSSGGDDGSQLRAVASSARPALDTSPRPQMSVPAPAPVEAAPARRLTTFAELVALAGEKRDLQIKAALEADVRLVRMEDGKLEVSLERSAARSMINDLSRKLEQWTGRRWTVIVSNEAGQADAARSAQAVEGQAHRRRAGRSAGAGGDVTVSRYATGGGAADRAGCGVRRRRCRARCRCGRRRRSLTQFDKGPFMADFLGMMKQAAQLQSKMKALQDELDTVEVEGVSGGGLVSVRMTAKGEVKAIKIDPSLIKADEGEILEDLLVTAHNDARRKAEAAMQEKMQALTGGLGLPPGLGLG